ncbi:MAG: hydroxyectoine utilization dehydratase EutB [Desulfobacterales bacterium]|nr:MAG: hydroxyectoine utilization dehydratase EutB [Desulfobacterales bacterium]
MKNFRPIRLKDIYTARRRISEIAQRSPLIYSSVLSERLGSAVYLKLENLQPTGSFKIRGAANAILGLSPDQKSRGVIAFSTGNHGRAVAYVAGRLGIKAVICLSKRVPAYRVNAMQKLGAEVVQRGNSQDEAYEYALEIREKSGLTMVNPFDDPLVIAGQGTIALEVAEDLPDVTSVIVPVSGGGLISGIAVALKSINPDVAVTGVSMDCAPAMFHSLQAGKPVEIEEKDSLADALLGGIGLDNRFTFQLVRDYVDRIILVSEREIADAMFFCLDQQRLAIEGAGAVGVSAILTEKIRDPGSKTVVVLSGGNVDTATLVQIANKRYGNKNEK